MSYPDKIGNPHTVHCQRQDGARTGPCGQCHYKNRVYVTADLKNCFKRAVEVYYCCHSSECKDKKFYMGTIGPLILAVPVPTLPTFPPPPLPIATTLPLTSSLCPLPTTLPPPLPSFHPHPVAVAIPAAIPATIPVVIAAAAVATATASTDREVEPFDSKEASKLIAEVLTRANNTRDSTKAILAAMGDGAHTIICTGKKGEMTSWELKYDDTKYGCARTGLIHTPEQKRASKVWITRNTMDVLNIYSLCSCKHEEFEKKHPILNKGIRINYKIKTITDKSGGDDKSMWKQVTKLVRTNKPVDDEETETVLKLQGLLFPEDAQWFFKVENPWEGIEKVPGVEWIECTGDHVDKKKIFAPCADGSKCPSIIIIPAGTGTGKSGAIAEELKSEQMVKEKKEFCDLSKNIGGIVSISPIQTLSQTLSDKFERYGITTQNYMDFLPSLSAEKDEKKRSKLREALKNHEDVIISLNSIDMLEMKTKHAPNGAKMRIPFVLYLDEVTAMLHYLVHSDTLPKKKTTNKLLVEMIRSAKYVVMTCADMSTHEVEWIRSIRRKIKFACSSIHPILPHRKGIITLWKEQQKECTRHSNSSRKRKSSTLRAIQKPALYNCAV